MTAETHTGPEEQEESLWWLTFSPATFVAHFMACYLTASLWCAKVVPEHGPLGEARWLIGGYSVVALALIALFGMRSLRRHRFGTAAVPHDFDTPGDRHRFLGFASFLLALLSAVGVVFVGMTVLFVGSCR